MPNKLKGVFANINAPPMRPKIDSHRGRSFDLCNKLIERIACVDEVDQEIIRLFYEAGSPSLLPKDMQAKLERSRVTSQQISRKILKMNKRSEKESGKQIAEKRGWHWALMSFAYAIWGELGKIDPAET